jgi:hypothetical protein
LREISSQARPDAQALGGVTQIMTIRNYSHCSSGQYRRILGYSQFLGA